MKRLSNDTHYFSENHPTATITHCEGERPWQTHLQRALRNFGLNPNEWRVSPSLKVKNCYNICCAESHEVMFIGICHSSQDWVELSVCAS